MLARRPCVAIQLLTGFGVVVTDSTPHAKATQIQSGLTIMPDFTRILLTINLQSRVFGLRASLRKVIL